MRQIYQRFSSPRIVTRYCDYYARYANGSQNRVAYGDFIGSPTFLNLGSTNTTLLTNVVGFYIFCVNDPTASNSATVQFRHYDIRWKLAAPPAPPYTPPQAFNVTTPNATTNQTTDTLWVIWTQSNGTNNVTYQNLTLYNASNVSVALLSSLGTNVTNANVTIPSNISDGQYRVGLWSRDNLSATNFSMSALYTPPQAFAFVSPNTSTITNESLIASWTQSNGTNQVVYQNLTLYNHLNVSQEVLAVLGTNSTSVSVSIPSSYPTGHYRLGVWSIDNLSATNFTLSDLFVLDRTPPTCQINTTQYFTSLLGMSTWECHDAQSYITNISVTCTNGYTYMNLSNQSSYTAAIPTNMTTFTCSYHVQDPWQTRNLHQTFMYAPLPPTAFTFVTPTLNEYVNGTYNTSWTASNGSNLVYVNVTLKNLQTLATTLVSALGVHQLYELINTTLVQDGQYELFVYALDDYNQSTQTTSDAFYIHNTQPSCTFAPPTTFYDINVGQNVSFTCDATFNTTLNLTCPVSGQSYNTIFSGQYTNNITLVNQSFLCFYNVTSPLYSVSGNQTYTYLGDYPTMWGYGVCPADRGDNAMWLYVIITAAMFAGGWFIGVQRDTFSKVLGFVCAIVFVIVGFQLAYCVEVLSYVIVVAGLTLVFRIILIRKR